MTQSGIEAWNRWATANAKSIVDHGAPLGKTRRIGAKGISDGKNEMAAYTIVETESHEAAARMFGNHPHFTIFPGHAVDVMECLPMPNEQFARPVACPEQGSVMTRILRE